MNISTFRPATGMHAITASQLDGLLQHRTEQEDLCFWSCPYGHNEVVFEGFVKCEGGLRHLVHRYEKATLHQAALDALQYGTFSQRPYRLAQACDGSITECALALFVRWCRATNRCPESLYRQAYEHEQTPCWNETIAAADWQGVAYPPEWNEQSKAGLLASLHEINYHSLANIVSALE
ncbi:MAG: hypothetical protein L0Z50_28585 [Verrucomicrobiales bacterium]|nr:hypothetical protein [Verrucomicrobiales bacterium]